jgi:hypothetical protein
MVYRLEHEQDCKEGLYMPKIYYAKEIYKKLPVSLQHPTALDTPIVPIRGLYVAGLHRNIFNIDHCVQLTAVDNEPARWVDYTRIKADMVDDGGGFILRGIRRRAAVPKVDKYTRTTAEAADDGAFIIRGIRRRAAMPSVTAYGNVTSDMVDDGGGFIIRGIRRRTLMPKIDRRTAVNRDHIGDSHCVKILDITNLPADIAGYSD